VGETSVRVRSEHACTDRPMAVSCLPRNLGRLNYFLQQQPHRPMYQAAGSTLFYKPITRVKHDATVCSYCVWQGEHVSVHPRGTGSTSSLAYPSPPTGSRTSRTEKGEGVFMTSYCVWPWHTNKDEFLLGCSRSRSLKWRPMLREKSRSYKMLTSLD
jgi:hypothetical protein